MKRHKRRNFCHVITLLNQEFTVNEIKETAKFSGFSFYQIPIIVAFNEITQMAKFFALIFVE